MLSNFRIARLFGIPLELHWGFVFVPLLGAFYLQPDIMQWDNWRLWGVVSVILLVLFGCVVLHELGHALIARRFGVGTKKIVLLPIGGLAMLERLPRAAGQEFWVAFAGPLVNIALALFTIPYFWTVGPEHRLQLGHYINFLIWPDSNNFYFGLSTIDQFVLGFAVLNLLIGVTNLIPVFPLDGGRMLRSVLALRMWRPQATKLAARISQAGVVILLAVAAYYRSVDPFVLFVFIFIYLSANHELRYAKTMIQLKDMTVGAVAQPLSKTFFTQTSLGEALSQRAKDQKYGMVTNQWNDPVGYIDLEKYKGHPQQTPLASLLKTDFFVLDFAANLADAYQEMQDRQVYVAAVLTNGQATHWLDSGMVGEELVAQAAAKKK